MEKNEVRKSQVKVAKIQEDPPRTSTTTMNSLPREISINILSRLPISSLLQVKCVCHSWRRLAQDPLLASMQFSRTAKNDPCLILHSDLPIQNHLYSLHFSSPDYTNLEMVTRSRVTLFPEFTIVGSCDGLLCLWHSLYNNEGCIYNPFTKECLRLPNPEQFHTQQRVAFGFGSCPMENVYKVVRIVYYKNRDEFRDPLVRRFSLPKSEVQVITLGNNLNSSQERSQSYKISFTWRSKGETSYQIEGVSSQVFVNGRIHWLSFRQGYQARCIVISFDLGDEQFRQVPSPSERIRFGIFCSHLVNLRGCLSAVVRGYESLYIWVMKEYGVEESWVKEFCIGGGQLSRELHVPEESLKLSQARVIWLLENGEILLEYKCKYLVSYDPKSGTFKELVYHGLPERFNTFVRVGRLNSISL